MSSLVEVFSDRLPTLEWILDRDVGQLSDLRPPTDTVPIGQDRLEQIMADARRETGEYLGVETPPCEYELFTKQPAPIREEGSVWIVAKSAAILMPASIALLSQNLQTIALATAIGAAAFGCAHGLARLDREIAEIRFEVRKSEWEKEKLDYPSYDIPKKKIILLPSPKYDVLNNAVHEYAHFLQYHYAETKNLTAVKEICDSKILSEGHARGVARNTAKRSADEARMHHACEKDIGEMKSVYLWAAAHCGKPVNEKLTAIAASRDDEEAFSMKEHGRPTFHAIGNAMFKMWELELGDSVYASILLSGHLWG